MVLSACVLCVYMLVLLWVVGTAPGVGWGQTGPGSAALSSGEERIQSQDSSYKRTFIWKIKEVEVICSRNGLRTQVIEIKEGP